MNANITIRDLVMMTIGFLSYALTEWDWWSNFWTN